MGAAMRPAAGRGPGFGGAGGSRGGAEGVPPRRAAGAGPGRGLEAAGAGAGAAARERRGAVPAPGAPLPPPTPPPECVTRPALPVQCTCGFGILDFALLCALRLSMRGGVASKWRACLPYTACADGSKLEKVIHVSATLTEI